MVAVPHPLPAVNKASTLPVLQFVVALVGVTVEPVTPLVVNVTVASHTGLPLASLSWNCRLQLPPGLVLEHDCVVLKTLPGGVYALTTAVPPSTAAAAIASEAPKSRSRRGAVETGVKILPPGGHSPSGRVPLPRPTGSITIETARSRSR